MSVHSSLPALPADSDIVVSWQNAQQDAVDVRFPVQQYPATLAIVSVFFLFFLFQVGWRIVDKAMFISANPVTLPNLLGLLVLVALWLLALVFFIKFFRSPRPEIWQLTRDAFRQYSPADGVNLFESMQQSDEQGGSFFPQQQVREILAADIQSFTLRNSERGARILVKTHSGNNIEIAHHASDAARDALRTYLQRWYQ